MIQFCVNFNLFKVWLHWVNFNLFKVWLNWVNFNLFKVWSKWVNFKHVRYDSIWENFNHYDVWFNQVNFNHLRCDSKFDPLRFFFLWIVDVFFVFQFLIFFFGLSIFDLWSVVQSWRNSWSLKDVFFLGSKILCYTPIRQSKQFKWKSHN